MKRHSWIFAMGLGMAASLLPAAPAGAADHRDGAQVLADPTTDINDVYTWMSADKSKVYLVMTVNPAADKTYSKFSDGAYFTFHTSSRATFASTTATPLDVICSFDQAQIISCWVGSTIFVRGDASPTAGLVSTAGGNVKIFAGVRKDHFFFNLDGFNQVRTNVKGAVAMNALTFNANGCPTMPAAVLTAQAVQLGRAPGGGAGSQVDFFKNLNTMAIVMELDTTLLNKGGPIISVWAATNRKG